MNWGVISRNVGIALICCASFMFLSALVAMLDGFDSSFSPLLLSAILTMMVGLFPLIYWKYCSGWTNKLRDKWPFRLFYRDGSVDKAKDKDYSDYHYHKRL